MTDRKQEVPIFPPSIETPTGSIIVRGPSVASADAWSWRPLPPNLHKVAKVRS